MGAAAVIFDDRLGLLFAVGVVLILTGLVLAIVTGRSGEPGDRISR
jgi:hypothetical protein